MSMIRSPEFGAVAGKRMKMAKFLDEKAWKFAVVGVVNTVVGSGIMFGLYNLAGCSYWVSSAANYFLTSILSYFLHISVQRRSCRKRAALCGEYRNLLFCRLRAGKAICGFFAEGRFRDSTGKCFHAGRNVSVRGSQLSGTAAVRVSKTTGQLTASRPEDTMIL